MNQEMLEFKVDALEKKVVRLLDTVYLLTCALNTVIDTQTAGFIKLKEAIDEKNGRIPHGRG